MSHFVEDAAHRCAKIVYLYRGATDSALWRDLGVGTLIPAHSSALGKVIKDSSRIAT